MDTFLFFEDLEYWTEVSRSAFIALLVFLIPSLCSAQQNLFNVPSAEITKKGTVFFQQQINVVRNPGSNTTIDYGVGDNLEVGANIFVSSDAFKNDSSASNPDILGNIQKAFDVTDRYKVSLGSQTGLTPNLRNGDTGLAEYAYLMNAVDLEHWGKYYLGSYLSNKTYGAGSSGWGALIGFDLPIIPDKLNLMGDLITGDGAISVGVLGLCLSTWHGWQLSLGAQFPAPSSSNDYGAVVEFTHYDLRW